jgi:hypothetical protein
MPDTSLRSTTALNVVGTAGKAFGTLMPTGLVVAVVGKGALGVVLLGVGAVCGALGVLADGRVKALEKLNETVRAAAERDAAAAEEVAREADERLAAATERDRVIDAALRIPVGTVADVNPSAIGVDAVDPRVLGLALRVEGDQLPYVDRQVDSRLREHLSRARSADQPALVCLYGPAKASKGREVAIDA